ncbi:MAG: NUDIX domain-containing protein, partial [Burkholderiaceae bacterium]
DTRLWARLAPGEVWPGPVFAPPATTRQIASAGHVCWALRYASGLTSEPIGFMASSMFSVLSGAGLMIPPDRQAERQAGAAPYLIDAHRLPLLEALLAEALGPEGWRHERFVLRDRSAGSLLDGARRPQPLVLERSLFRPLGLLSTSVQLTLRTPEGKHWIGKRAAHKRIDPGLWDAAAAGGLPAHESAATAVRREASEEAGLSEHLLSRIRFVGRVRVCRLLPDCLHHEQVWVFTASLPASEQPNPSDGEVEVFDCVWPEEILRRYRAGQFNHEAACGSLLEGLDQTHPGLATKR